LYTGAELSGNGFEPVADGFSIFFGSFGTASMNNEQLS
jgi:hypothetical protein